MSGAVKERPWACGDDGDRVEQDVCKKDFIWHSAYEWARHRSSGRSDRLSISCARLGHATRTHLRTRLISRIFAATMRTEDNPLDYRSSDAT